MARRSLPGRLFVLEGPDGVGKSTFVRALGEHLRSNGHDLLELSFPGKVPGSLGELVYRVHHDEGPLRVANISLLAKQVLPMAEAIARISDQVFAAVDTRPVYVHDGAQRLQRFIRQFTGSADVVVTPADVVARSAHAVMASADEWAAIREIQERLPEAHTVLRHHLLLSKRHQGVPSIVIIGALVTLKHGPFVLRREYIVSDRQSAALLLRRWITTENGLDLRRPV